jgi:hypothetical protein
LPTVADPTASGSFDFSLTDDSGNLTPFAWVSLAVVGLGIWAAAS